MDQIKIWNDELMKHYFLHLIDDDYVLQETFVFNVKSMSFQLVFFMICPQEARN